MSFDTLGLSAELLRAVADQGYSVPTPVQRLSIPPILLGRDIMARAQTGTGKTAGFALPLLQRLSAPSPNRHRRVVRTLILTPTRELAAQVREDVRVYGRYLPLKSVAIFGGVGFPPQVQQLRGGVEIVVATPGRLLDHVARKTVDLSKVEILVLDEADRMLDMGFINDIRKILAELPASRQNLLFSATLSPEIQKLADGLLSSPTLVEVESDGPAAEGVSHVAHPVDQGRKAALLSFLIKSGDWKQVLVFTRTKRGADRLARQLMRDGTKTVALHSDKSQGARTAALAAFKRGELRVLVATDIAARGLDIDRLSHVVNFELPHAPEDYVHRVGRTARAGNHGDAVSLVCADERTQLQAIERFLKRAVPKVVISGFEPNRAVGSEPRSDRSSASRKDRSRGGAKRFARPDSRSAGGDSIPKRRGSRWSRFA